MKLFYKAILVICIGFLIFGILSIFKTRPIFNDISKEYLDKSLSNITIIERESILNKTENCRIIMLNRFMINPMNIFKNKEESHNNVVLSLKDCFKEYVINGNNNNERKFREEQINNIIK